MLQDSGKCLLHILFVQKFVSQANIKLLGMDDYGRHLIQETVKLQ